MAANQCLFMELAEMQFGITISGFKGQSPKNQTGHKKITLRVYIGR